MLLTLKNIEIFQTDQKEINLLPVRYINAFHDFLFLSFPVEAKRAVFIVFAYAYKRIL